MSDNVTIWWLLCTYKPLPLKSDDESYHLEEVDELGLMTDPILSSQGNEVSDPEDVSLFEFETLFDVVFEMENIKMTRCGLSEDILHLLSASENEQSKKIYERCQTKYLAYTGGRKLP